MVSFDPAASQDAIAVVADHGLPWRDAILRFVECHAQPRIGEHVNLGRHALAVVADFYLAACRRCADTRRGSEPVRVFGRQPVAGQLFLAAEHDPPRLVLEPDDEPRLAERDAQAFALADRELLEPVVLT